MGSRASASAGPTGRAHVVDAINRVRAAVQPQWAGDRGGRGERSRTPAHIEAAIAHNAAGCPGFPTRSRKLGIDVDAERRRISSCLSFGGNGVGRAAEADAFLSARGFILRAVSAYGLPECLRLTVGSEEANRGVVEALAEFVQARSWLSGSGRRSTSRSSTSWRSSASG